MLDTTGQCTYLIAGELRVQQTLWDTRQLTHRNMMPHCAESLLQHRTACKPFTDLRHFRPLKSRSLQIQASTSKESATSCVSTSKGALPLFTLGGRHRLSCAIQTLRLKQRLYPQAQAILTSQR